MRLSCGRVRPRDDPRRRPGCVAAFYELVFDATSFAGEPFAGGGLCGWNDFSIAPADAAHPATRRLHLGFAAPSRTHIDGFWETLASAGYTDDGASGPRPQYRPDYYGAYVLDPDGHNVEAVCHHRD
jgi:catechol 2,3-dioxygenase-like lactoylglutathione lyase family enzyme